MVAPTRTPPCGADGGLPEGTPLVTGLRGSDRDDKNKIIQIILFSGGVYVVAVTR